jgi:histidinol dehydrogenase
VRAVRIIRSNDDNQAEVDRLIKRDLNLDYSDVSPGAAKRSIAVFGKVLSPLDAAETIVSDVRAGGDEAMNKYTLKLDGALISSDTLRVSDDEIKNAYKLVEPEIVDAIDTAKKNIARFHKRQIPKSWFTTEPNGVLLGERFMPIESAGIYVPGGTARYPSSVLMNAVPAKVAGVERVVMVTPPTERGEVSPYVLVAADKAGVDEIYKVGGAQAIAALAFGTESVPRVDKIAGPGNIFVTLAKRLVYGYVGIDMLAGPSEIVIIADESAPVSYVAADLLSQAEHDPNAAALLFTADEALAEAVSKEVVKQTEKRNRKNTIAASLMASSAIILTRTLEEAISLANRCAPEHLELMVRDPFTVLGKIKHAGAIFLGPYSSEPVGDYMAGTNHVLPTNGTARFFSPLGVWDFLKRSSVISYSKEGLMEVKDDIIRLAEAEGLDAHANAVRVRS